jgi:hypothetical protein
MEEKVYKPRQPKRTKLWQCLHAHFADYLKHYKEKYEKSHGYLRPIEDLARKLRAWQHSGFSVHKGEPVKREERSGLERLAQYIIRNPFSEEKMIYNEKTGSVIYCSKPKPKVKGNFKVFTAGEFIGAITQHIPDFRFAKIRAAEQLIRRAVEKLRSTDHLLKCSKI